MDQEQRHSPKVARIKQDKRRLRLEDNWSRSQVSTAEFGPQHDFAFYVLMWIHSRKNQSFPCQGSPVSCLRRFSHLLDSLEEDEKHLSQRPKGKVAEDWSGEKTGRAIWGVTLVELYQSMGSTLGLWKHETNRWGLYLTLPVCPITCPRGFTTMILCGNLTPYSLGSEISYQCPDTLPMKMVVSHGLAFSEITHRNYYFHSKLYYCLPSAGFAFRLLFFFFPSFLTGKVRLFIWDLSSLFKLVL